MQVYTSPETFVLDFYYSARNRVAFFLSLHFYSYSCILFLFFMLRSFEVAGRGVSVLRCYFPTLALIASAHFFPICRVINST